ncbi:putative sulfite oxidase [Aulographum hederae CBS 113979]|uniref:Putative sulfite oxidase n=1 Tax=Aulographum hederae CBS 113979 TaxID=1176131 RepID=A0A6G1HD60_9PEZI|nr:putative sulfite oxidase [Aulographum hederae CBS 113979]
MATLDGASGTGKNGGAGEENKAPLNRAPEMEELVSSYLTRTNGYERNHCILPQISESHTLHITGAPIRTPLSLNRNDLLTSFPQHTVLSALQCAGNRRHSMRTLMKEVQGLDWRDNAVMNCLWRGPRIRDVIEKAGLIEEILTEGNENADARDEKEKYRGWYVQFECRRVECEKDSWYGAGIPLERVMRKEADCILALEMNNEPLTPAHGYPVRALLPGIAGARSVKWLDRIVVSNKESQNFYQKFDYKVLPPHCHDADMAALYWEKTPPVVDMPINSAIGIPAADSTVTVNEEGFVDVVGYALPAGEDGPVVKVEVSGDEGESWIEATLSYGGHRKKDVSLKWGWCLWYAKVRMEKGTGRRILSRARDRGGNVQKENCEWNLKGVQYNAYGQVRGLEVV